MPFPLAAGALLTDENANRIGQAAETVFKVSLGLAALGGAYFVGRSVINSARENLSERRALDQGSPSYYASLLGEAMNVGDIWNFAKSTDLEMVYHTAEVIRPGDLDRVEAAFKAQFRENLVSALKDNLSETDYLRVLNILKNK